MYRLLTSWEQEENSGSKMSCRSLWFSVGESTVWLVVYKGNFLVDTTKRFVRVLKMI